MKSLIFLKSQEAKRIIARGVLLLPEVQLALKNGIIHLARGTTNGFIYEELTGKTIDRNKYTAGYIGDGRLNVLPPEERIKSITLKKGELLEMEPQETLPEMTKGDVFIKGGNALDVYGNVGVLCAQREGGTIGMAFGPATVRGIHLICPISLNKMIPSVLEAAECGGLDTYDSAMGIKSSLFPVTTAQVFTEIDALEVIYGLQAVLVASGGVKDLESALVFSVEGEDEAVLKLIKDIEKLRE